MEGDASQDDVPDSDDETESVIIQITPDIRQFCKSNMTGSASSSSLDITGSNSSNSLNITASASSRSSDITFSASNSSLDITTSASSSSLDPVTVISVDKRKTNNKWDKKHSCKYCTNLVTKMSSHLQRCHSDETEVAQVLAMRKGSQERRRAWLKMLNEGDYKHNYAALENGVGTLIPKYRSKNKTVEDVVICSHCNGLYKTTLLYLHVKRCAMRNSTMKRERGTPASDDKLLMPMPNHIAGEFYKQIIQPMRQEDISRLVQNDSLIILYGERMFYRKDIEEHTSNQVSSRLREIGRLLQCLRRASEMKISTLTQALHPSNFNLLLECVREVAGFEADTHQFKEESLSNGLKVEFLFNVHSLRRFSSLKQKSKFE